MAANTARRCGLRFDAAGSLPGFDGALLSLDWKDALWAKFSMGAPAHHRHLFWHPNSARPMLRDEHGRYSGPPALQSRKPQPGCDPDPGGYSDQTKDQGQADRLAQEQCAKD